MFSLTDQQPVTSLNGIYNGLLFSYRPRVWGQICSPVIVDQLAKRIYLAAVFLFDETTQKDHPELWLVLAWRLLRFSSPRKPFWAFCIMYDVLCLTDRTVHSCYTEGFSLWSSFYQVLFIIFTAGIQVDNKHSQATAIGGSGWRR